MVKKKSSNRVKRNHASKCAEIDFSYKQCKMLKQLIFTANLRLLLKAPERSENYIKSHMVKVGFEKQFIRKRVERKPSSTFSAFFSLLSDDRFLISFQIQRRRLNESPGYVAEFWVMGIFRTCKNISEVLSSLQTNLSFRYRDSLLFQLGDISRPHYTKHVSLTKGISLFRE